MLKKYNKAFLFISVLTLTLNAYSQTIDATLLEFNFLPDGYPENFIESNGGFYFTIEGDQLWFSDGSINGTFLVKDFGESIAAEIKNLFSFQDRIFFSAKVGNLNHFELWVSDGTNGGTKEVTQRNLDRTANGEINNITEYGGKIYFDAEDENIGRELWVSDGTMEGTFMVKDIAVGESSSYPSDFMVFKDSLFFIANNQENGSEIWVSDGTQEGTQLFLDINSGPESGVYTSNINSLVQSSDVFFFYAHVNDSGTELWKSDGTVVGTNLVKDIREGQGSSNTFIQGEILKDKLLFVATDGINGTEIWNSDGTEEGTFMLTDVNPNEGKSFLYGEPVLSFGELKMFFIAYNSSLEPTLWVTDGTVEGTSFIKSLYTAQFVFDQTGSNVIFFASANGIKGLYKSDGTVTGTKLISQEVHDFTGSRYSSEFLLFEDKVYFSGKNDQNGIELWITDGSTEGTQLFKDFNTASGVTPSNITEVGDKVFFACSKDGLRSLCVYDSLKESFENFSVTIEGRGTADTSEMIELNGKLLFIGHTQETGYELWTSDGSQENTFILKDIYPGVGGGFYSEGSKHSLRKIDDRVYFTARDGINGYELWVTDGTAEGTLMIKDILPGSGGGGPSSSAPQGFVRNDDGNIYFYANEALTSNTTLFRTDGTSSGTEGIISLYRIEIVETIGNEIIFVANDSSINTSEPNSVWVSDGTMEGTKLLGSYGTAYIRFFAVLNNEFYFVVSGNIYKTDGTSEGTTMIFDRTEHPFQNVGIYDIVSCGEYVYFGVKQSPNFYNPNMEIWRTDGSKEGTVFLTTSETGYAGLYDFTCLNDNLYFLDFGNGDNIWVTNGDVNSVFKLELSVNNGQGFSSGHSVVELGVAENFLYFNGRTDESGNELYVTTPSRLASNNEFVDSDSDGVVDFFDKCDNTDSGLQVDEMGCALNQLDDDNDGITNDLDICPETELGLPVDENGCASNQSIDEDQDGINNNLDLCPNTPIGEVVNSSGCSESQLDDDNDGVSNDLDQCARTETGLQVDEKGCPQIFQLSSTNFQLQTFGETCVGKNNGMISIAANDTSYSYTAQIAGQVYEFKSALEVSNLEPGQYDFCITIDNYPEYRQCYKVDIPPAEEISGKSITSAFGRSHLETIEINKGTPPYIVYVNNEKVLETTSSLFSLNVENGDMLQVTSKFPCEGIYEKTIREVEKSFLFPNPTSDSVHLNFKDKLGSTIEVFILNTAQELMFKRQYPLTDSTINVSLKSLPSGIYFIKVISGNSSDTFKVIKR
jgi:ELWxxDGT repeat protein